MKSVLVVVAHPDDEVLGFGATGAKLAKVGHRVQPVILCGGVDARTLRPTDVELHRDIVAACGLLGFSEPITGSFPNLRMNTVDHIDLVRFIEEQVERFQPDTILTHHANDLNNDHLQVSRACLAASRLSQRRPGLKHARSVYFMEILSSTDWSYAGSAPSFEPNTFVEVGDTIQLKVDALSKYRHVMRPYPHPRSSESLKALATYRGSQAGVRSAEAFQLALARDLV